jgi:hypothetical protein
MAPGGLGEHVDLKGVGARGLTVWVSDDFCDFSLPSGADLSVKPLKQVKSTGPERKPPGLISDAVLPENRSCEWRKWFHGISHKAPGGMGVKPKHEDNEEMMCVPKRLKALLTDFGVCTDMLLTRLSSSLRTGENIRGVHEHHAEQHDMSSYSARLGIMNIQRCLLSDLRFLDIEETVEFFSLCL